MNILHQAGEWVKICKIKNIFIILPEILFLATSRTPKES